MFACISLQARGLVPMLMFVTRSELGTDVTRHVYALLSLQRDAPTMKVLPHYVSPTYFGTFHIHILFLRGQLLHQDPGVCRKQHRDGFITVFCCRMLPGSSVSAAVYLPLVQAQGTFLFQRNAEVIQETQSKLQELFERIEALPDACSLRLLLLTEYTADRALGALVPINALRNAALLAIRTPLAAMIDVDLAVSDSLRRVLAQPDRLEAIQHASTVFWVLPTWEAESHLKPEDAQNTVLSAIKDPACSRLAKGNRVLFVAVLDTVVIVVARTNVCFPGPPQFWLYKPHGSLTLAFLASLSSSLSSSSSSSSSLSFNGIISISIDTLSSWPSVTWTWAPELPGDKKRLQMLWQTRHLRTFSEDIFPQGHNATDYRRWLSTDQPYTIRYGRGYEPWGITSRKQYTWMPYDVRFRGCFRDKVTQVASLAYINTSFAALPDAWLVHQPHQLSAAASIAYAKSNDAIHDYVCMYVCAQWLRVQALHKVVFYRGINTTKFMLHKAHSLVTSDEALGAMAAGRYEPVAAFNNKQQIEQNNSTVIFIHMMQAIWTQAN
ncbi:hypothetical protein VOLCADRAFT_92485 [Volvox carteri f. nagariensis]|uniref:Uncharacterized protein n=1 Tax=Volvox carteri f. nagariensis TaxID=3068 RepID=D8TZS6_VOLCA|nr:uncharacterized protein VOLCADRAFT_92485 [Volvox carteri f. nagariensis]EFJ47067.1 hypothetical protein VOLCADRAFT_92485 [Volvox carteri f. nagariensis]|eukprot:XP_002951962.1 hypothetical protein VOLCADRAFT_92485 [Volvox carteri f. nagariensis]